MKPKKETVPAVKPANLENVPVDALITELHRRKSEVAFIAVTPSDLNDYWGTDNNGDPLPTNVPPTPEEWIAAFRAFDRWQDHGAFTEAMEAMGGAWIEEQLRRKAGKEESK
jgi:hypothetical protein